MNNFVGNVVKLLNISDNYDIINTTDEISGSIEKAIFKHNKHPSIININEKNKEKLNKNDFRIRHTSIKNVSDLILNIDVNKASPMEGIPANILKANYDLISPILCNDFNKGVDNNAFPDCLKCAEIKPTFKRGDRSNKENYRPVSILPVVSKIYEKILYEQINMHFDPLLSPLQCGFRKGYNAQNCLLVLVEKWKKAIDKKRSAGILVTDLSKAFDCIRHDLLIAKLNAYGVEINSLRYIYNYLSNRKQRVRINNTFSEWNNIIYGVPQGSILGPLFFNIFLCDLFFITENYYIVNYADDNTPYACENNINNVLESLENCALSLFKWISQNFLKINPNKSHLVLSTREDLIINIQSVDIHNTISHKLLGIKIDNELKFDVHINDLCNKANLKLHALARISSYMSSQKIKIIMKAFILSQFNYCPLVWMFHSRDLNNRINRIHERALRIAYKDKLSSFEELLKKDESVTIHHKNLHILATEIYKFINGLAPKIMGEVFQLKDINYNLRADVTFKSSNVHTVHYGQQSVSYLAPRIWRLVPDNIKKSPSIQSFKSKIKTWIPVGCPCRLCKQYQPNLGFI